MQSRHGSLEGAILSVLWNLEAKGICSNTVLDVCKALNEMNGEKRAYTTIKTVMDRLFEKKVLYRYKPAKKFFYRTVYSQKEMVMNSLNEIATRFCGGNFEALSEIVNSHKEIEKTLVPAG